MPHGGRRPGAGRPGPRRTERVVIPLTRLELETLRLAADSTPLATWLRELALRAVTPRAPTSDSEDPR